MATARVKEAVFKFVVARPWCPDDPARASSICIYTYGSEIQEGTMTQAQSFLEYVRSQNKDKKEAKQYGIYAVGLTKIV